MARARGWCFTIHECGKENLDKINSIECEYIIVGDEITPTTKKQHWQGFLYFKNARSFNSIKNILPYGTHIEHAIASAEKNKRYCSKEAVLFEKGNIPFQGKRNDITLMIECVEDGANMRELMKTSANFQSVRIAEKALLYFEQQRDWLTNVYWFWGPSGTGKTRTAKKMFPKAWTTTDDLRWWQGYDAHEDVIIDDFRSDFCRFVTLLRVLDRYSYTVETKGGSRQLLAKNIVITCPTKPECTYNTSEEQVCQLLRRITVIREFKPLKTIV